MGKSNKKVKSDRINALRKQYDAFLEEDKKRKDRNDFILERIDKMRSCTAIVQVRDDEKAAFPGPNQSNYERKGYFQNAVPTYERPRMPFSQVNISSSPITTSFNEEILLKEISKKYILIPRHSNTLQYGYNFSIKSNVDDSTDWKSKYNILEELKKNEIEEETPKNKKIDDKEDILEEIPTKELSIDSHVNASEFSLSDFNNKAYENDNFDAGIDTRPQNMPTEKEFSEVSIADHAIPTLKENVKLSEVCRDESYIENGNMNAENLTEKEKIQTEYEIKLKPNEEESPIKIIKDNTQIQIVNNKNQEPVQTLSETYVPPENVTNGLEIQNIVSDEGINNDIGKTDDSDNIKKISLSEANVAPTEIAEYPASVNNINEYLPIEGADIQEISNLHEEVYEDNQGIINPSESTALTETGAVNPIDSVEHCELQPNAEQNIQNTVDVNQIQDFEAEQNGMFYTEPADADYPYDQTDTGETNNTEYQNNENYEQNEHYNYYENAPQEQAYSSEINEHEESTEQYDPHYEEQYGNYEQEDRQYESVDQHEAVEYLTQQDYDQVQYEQTNYNGEEIEQQLDNEQGLIETQNVIEENINSNVPTQCITENQGAEQEETVT